MYQVKISRHITQYMLIPYKLRHFHQLEWDNHMYLLFCFWMFNIFPFSELPLTSIHYGIEFSCHYEFSPRYVVPQTPCHGPSSGWRWRWLPHNGASCKYIQQPVTHSQYKVVLQSGGRQGVKKTLAIKNSTLWHITDSERFFALTSAMENEHQIWNLECKESI